MTIEIQPNIDCENCIKCGKRPHVEQTKKHWIVACPDKACGNAVQNTFVDIKKWNKLNKKDTNISSATLSTNPSLKKTA